MPADNSRALLDPRHPGARTSIVLVVLGARSGTSALAGTLGLLGCKLPNNMMAANWANKKGYFEPQDLAELHNELLASVGSVWHDSRPFPPAWFRSHEARQFQARLANSYRDNYLNATISVLREPRMCRILPLWDDIFDELEVVPAFIFIDRNPFEVAASLAARDGSSLEHGLLYYIRNHLEAERDTRGRCRTFMSYDMLLDDWRTAIAVAADRIGISLSPTAQQEIEIDRFLERGLRTQDHDQNYAANELQEAALAICDAYKALALGRPEDPIRDRLDAIRAKFDGLSRADGADLPA